MSFRTVRIRPDTRCQVGLPIWPLEAMFFLLRMCVGLTPLKTTDFGPNHNFLCLMAHVKLFLNNERNYKWMVWSENQSFWGVNPTHIRSIFRSKTRTPSSSPTPRNAAELSCFRLACCLLLAAQAVRRGAMGVGAFLRRRGPLAYMRRPPQQADAAPDLAASASSSSRCNRRRQGGIVITGLVGSAPAAIGRVLSGDRSCVLFWSQSAPLCLVGSRSRLFPGKSKLSSRR